MSEASHSSQARALVFDLDDTLMDTQGQLVDQAHYQACVAMHRAGLDVPVEQLFARRQKLLQEQPRGDVDRLLAQDFDCHDPDIIASGRQTYFNPEFDQLEPFPQVPELLARLKRQYPLFLLTSGYAETQARKVAALKIADFFEEIYYASIDNPLGKQEALQALSAKHGLAYPEIWVIGDRITNEIVIGNRLGCPTVWVQHGECAHIQPESPEEMPDFRVESVLELPNLLPNSTSDSKSEQNT